MNKHVKSYDEFKTELLESRKIDEGIIDSVRGAIKKIGDWFKGVGEQFMNMLLLQKENDLPKGITIYPTQADLAVARQNGVNFTPPVLKSVEESLELEEGLDPNDSIPIDHPNPDVPNVGIPELRSLVGDVVKHGEYGTPLLIWGVPGIGKTSIVNFVAKQFYGPSAKEERRLIDYDLMSMNYDDFFLPDIEDTPEGKKKVVRPDKVLPVYEMGEEGGDERVNGPDGKGGILFFDEIARADTNIKKVCLKLIDEKKIGNYQLGSKWVIVSAANRESDEKGKGEFDFTKTLGSRFQQVNFSPTFDEWEKFFASDEAGTWTPVKGKPPVARVLPEILTFLSFNKQYFFHLDTSAKDSANKATTLAVTPRGWTKFSELLQLKEIHDGKMPKGEELIRIGSRLIGMEAAREFDKFTTLVKQIPIEDIKNVYSDPTKAPLLKSMKMDIKDAMCGAVLYHKQSGSLKDKEKMNFAEWIVLNDDAPYAIKLIRLIQEFHPGLKKDDYWQQECKSYIFDEYGEALGDEK